MFSFATSDTTAPSTVSSVACSLFSKPRPILIAGRDPTPAGRRSVKNNDDAQLIRLTGFKEEDIRLMKVMFDFYDQDRDGKLTPSQACLLCTTLGFHPVETSSIRCSDEGEVDFKQLVQSAGFVRANQSPPGARGGTTKHFYRMATRNASHSMSSEQVHHFFESIGVDIPQPAVDRIATTVSSEGDTCLKEDELVEYVERIRKRQDAMVANQQGGPTRSQTSRNVPRGGARGR